MPRLACLPLAMGVTAAGACARLSTTADAAPPSAWTQYAAPEDAGFSSAALDTVRAYADSARSGAVMAIYRGRVLVAWGDVARKFQLHSVRKSLVSALYGTAVARRQIDLDATLAVLGIDDIGKLTMQEKTARVRDVIAARSGVYLSGAYGGTEQAAERPARGAYPPGTHWSYNNWDFNLAGVIYERLTGEDLYQSFARRIAAPIGMEDYTPSDGFLVLEPTYSMYPAHTFRMSTRDLARFGQLYLQRGAWNGRQVVPADWVTTSTTQITKLGTAEHYRDGTGYGYMWWVYEPGSAGANLPTIDRHRVIVASGTGGQGLFIIPDADLVIVNRGDTDNGDGVAGGRAWRIAEGILKAQRSAPSGAARTVALSAVPFMSQQPAPATPQYLTLDAAARARLVGQYRFQGPDPIRVYVYQDRLFGFVPGLGEAELFAVSPDELTLRAQSGVRILVTRDADGRATAVRFMIGGRTINASRIP